MNSAFYPLLAVHLSDGFLTAPWWIGGFVVAGILALVGAWRIRDEEIPQTALLTAAFFVVSLINVRIPPTSVHLLFNGLVGVVLGRRSALAIPIALFLQAVCGHGGFTTLGINSCIMVLPALLAWQVFALMRRVPWVRERWFRAGLVAVSTLVWTHSLLFCVVLIATNYRSQVSHLDLTVAVQWMSHPATLIVGLFLALLSAWGERRLENAPEFPLGLLLGELTVLATVFLACLVLVWGGPDDWPTLVLAMLVPHLFIAVIEGVVLGFTVGFLVRVKPEMVGWFGSEKKECLVDSLP